MGTKEKPTKYNGYAKAEPDEPMFVLLARDPDAADLVDEWVKRQELRGTSRDKLNEALACAQDMRAWRNRPKL